MNSEHQSGPSKSDPYCAFNDDRERRCALHSRDCRDVSIAALRYRYLAATAGFGLLCKWGDALLRFLQ
jgi:hypothetical protein